MRNHNKRLLRWSLVLQEYHLRIHHVRGCDNVVADALSRPAWLELLFMHTVYHVHVLIAQLFPPHLSLSLSLVVNFLPFIGYVVNGSVVIPVNPDMLN